MSVDGGESPEDDADGSGADGSSGSGRSARRRRAPDPLGTRALFWAPGSGGAAEPPPPTGPSPLGKHALFSTARDESAARPHEPVPSSRGPITVTCSSCRARTRTGLLDFLIFQLPIGVWLPRGRFDHRMTCPACRRRVWASVTFRRA